MDLNNTNGEFSTEVDYTSPVGILSSATENYLENLTL